MQTVNHCHCQSSCSSQFVLLSRRVAAADCKRTVQEDYEVLAGALQGRQALIEWLERAKHLILELLENKRELARLAMTYDLGCVLQVLLLSCCTSL